MKMDYSPTALKQQRTLILVFIDVIYDRVFRWKGNANQIMIFRNTWRNILQSAPYKLC